MPRKNLPRDKKTMVLADMLNRGKVMKNERTAGRFTVCQKDLSGKRLDQSNTWEKNSPSP